MLLRKRLFGKTYRPSCKKNARCHLWLHPTPTWDNIRFQLLTNIIIDKSNIITIIKNNYSS